MDFITEKWFIESVLITVGAVIFMALFCKVLDCWSNKNKEENKWH
jgi:hypothetical protein